VVVFTSGTLREANPTRFLGAAVVADSVSGATGLAELLTPVDGLAELSTLSTGSLGLLEPMFMLTLPRSLSPVAVRRDRCKLEPCLVRRVPDFESSAPDFPAGFRAGAGLDAKPADFAGWVC